MSNASKIKALIKSAGLTQRSAAEKVGIDERTMRRYCSEVDSYDAPQAVKMALQHLGCRKGGYKV